MREDPRGIRDLRICSLHERGKLFQAARLQRPNGQLREGPAVQEIGLTSPMVTGTGSRSRSLTSGFTTIAVRDVRSFSASVTVTLERVSVITVDKAGTIENKAKTFPLVCHQVSVATSARHWRTKRATIPTRPGPLRIGLTPAPFNNSVNDR